MMLPPASTTLPALRGSVAQVAWAYLIREEAMRNYPDDKRLQMITSANALIDQRLFWGVK